MTKKGTHTDGTPIEELKNLGVRSGKRLREIGINTVEDLIRVGPVQAYVRLLRMRPNVSIVFLWAMVAGLSGAHFADVPEGLKAKLRRQVEEASSGGTVPAVSSER